MRPIARWPALETALLAAVFGFVAAAGASAQTLRVLAQFGGDTPCVLDKCLNGAKAPPHPDPGPLPAPTGDPLPPGSNGPRMPSAGVAPGTFDFYVLSLSWSPGFCESGGAAKARQQCEPGAKLGFVVHGLWPQNQHGYPSNCDSPVPYPSRAALDSVRGLYPDEGLARHEWRMHGTCTGLNPAAYFASVRQARAAIAVPQPFLAPEGEQTWAPLDIARAFTAANPRLRNDTMAVTCRQNRLEEVRICLSKDLRGFVPCPEVARASCRRPITVPPVL